MAVFMRVRNIVCEPLLTGAWRRWASVNNWRLRPYGRNIFLRLGRNAESIRVDREIFLAFTSRIQISYLLIRPLSQNKCRAVKHRAAAAAAKLFIHPGQELLLLHCLAASFDSIRLNSMRNSRSTLWRRYKAWIGNYVCKLYVKRSIYMLLLPICILMLRRSHNLTNPPPPPSPNP